MKNKSSLSSYVFGLLTGFVFIPVTTEALSIVYSYIQLALIKPSKAVIKGNEELQKMQGEQEGVCSNVIGFEYPNVDEYYDDWDIEDKNNSKKYKK